MHSQFLEGHIERQEFLQLVSKEQRLRRLKEVRLQEKSIATDRCLLYREKISEQKQQRKNGKIDEKTNHLKQAHDSLAVNWQASLLDTGMAHRTAKKSSSFNFIQSKLVESNNMKRNLAAETREKEASKKLLEIMQESNATLEERNRLLEIRRELSASNREDAKATAEARKIVRVQQLQRKAEAASQYNGPVVVREQPKAEQSALSVLDRGVINIQARILRHGSDVSRDKSAVLSIAEAEDNKAIRKLFSRALEELKNKIKSKQRVRNATKSSIAVQNVETLESVLIALQISDRSGTRIDRVKNSFSVIPNSEKPVIAQAFEKAFLSTQKGKENLENMQSDSSTSTAASIASSSLESASILEEDESLASSDVDSVEGILDSEMYERNLKAKMDKAAAKAKRRGKEQERERDHNKKTQLRIMVKGKTKHIVAPAWQMVSNPLCTRTRNQGTSSVISSLLSSRQGTKPPPPSSTHEYPIWVPARSVSLGVGYGLLGSNSANHITSGRFAPASSHLHSVAAFEINKGEEDDDDSSDSLGCVFFPCFKIIFVINFLSCFQIYKGSIIRCCNVSFWLLLLSLVRA